MRSRNHKHTCSQARCIRAGDTAFAQLILDASYEAAFLAGVLNAIKTGNTTMYLTLLSGGAFGNAEIWIMAAIERSLRLFEDCDLEVAIVSYGSSKASIQQLVASKGCNSISTHPDQVA